MDRQCSRAQIVCMRSLHDILVRTAIWIHIHRTVIPTDICMYKLTMLPHTNIRRNQQQITVPPYFIGISLVRFRTHCVHDDFVTSILTLNDVVFFLSFVFLFYFIFVYIFFPISHLHYILRSHLEATYVRIWMYACAGKRVLK